MQEKITRSPYLNLLSGLVPLVGSSYETPHTLDYLSRAALLGVLIFSLIQILKTLPEFVDGAKELAEVKSAA